MKTTPFMTATDYFRQLAAADVIQSVDDGWERFANYLANRSKQLPAIKIDSFRRVHGQGLMNILHRCLQKGPSELLDPTSEDIDAPFFREFNENSDVLDEVKGFIECENYKHFFDNTSESKI